MQLNISYGKRQFMVEVVKGVIKHLAITVHPDLRITAKAPLGAKEPIIKIRKMEKRWGHCSRNKGIIVFNIDLIKAPIHCVDYVVIHELCHLLSAKHDKKFYGLLEKILPNWATCKARLEKASI